MTDPLAVTRQDALLLALFGLSYAAALILWTEGTTLVTAAESGFLGTAETPFAMLRGSHFLAEFPHPASFLGAGLVLAAVLGHALAYHSRVRAPARGSCREKVVSYG